MSNVVSITTRVSAASWPSKLRAAGHRKREHRGGEIREGDLMPRRGLAAEFCQLGPGSGYPSAVESKSMTFRTLPVGIGLPRRTPRFVVQTRKAFDSRMTRTVSPCSGAIWPTSAT